MPVWCAHMGTLTFHPWPVRRDDVDHPDELRIDLDPQPGTTFADAVRVAGVARELLDDLGMTGFAKTSGNRGIHIYVRIEPRWEFADVRHAAIAFGRELEKRDDGVTTAWWKEERGERIFVDFNQNTRDRTIASAYSLRPIAGAPVSTPVTWDELAGLDSPKGFNLFTVPERLAADGDPWATIDDVHHSLEPLLDAVGRAPRRAQLPARPPEDAGGAAARAAVEEGRVALGRGGQPDPRLSGAPATDPRSSGEQSRFGGANLPHAPPHDRAVSRAGSAGAEPASRTARAELPGRRDREVLLEEVVQQPVGALLVEGGDQVVGDAEEVAVALEHRLQLRRQLLVAEVDVAVVGARAERLAGDQAVVLREGRQQRQVGLRAERRVGGAARPRRGSAPRSPPASYAAAGAGCASSCWSASPRRRRPARGGCSARRRGRGGRRCRAGRRRGGRRRRRRTARPG